MVSNYERYFGTVERAASTLFALSPKYQGMLECGERMMTKRFGEESIWKHDLDRALSWIDWLKEEGDGKLPIPPIEGERG